MIDVSIQRTAHRLLRPFRAGSREWKTRDSVLVTIADGKHSGVGEAAPLPGHSPETVEQAEAALRQKSDIIAKLATTDASGDLALKLAKSLGDCPSAVFAAETALYDFWAARWGCRMMDIWGPGERDRVPVSGVIDLAAASGPVRDLLRNGIRTFKVKLEAGPEKNVERVKSLRDCLPEDAAIRGDANGIWSYDEAVWNLKALEPLGLEFVEQPLAVGQEKKLRALGRETSVPLAVDESLAGASELAELLKAKAVQYYVLKPTILGGWRATRDAIRKVERAGARWVLSSGLESAVGRRACFELACTLGGPFLPAGLLTSSWFGDDDGLCVSDGALVRREERAGAASQ